MQTLIAVPGIGAPHGPKPEGILKRFADQFTAGNVVTVQFNYANNYGPVGGTDNGQSYDDNLTGAVLSLVRMIRECPNKVILTGHSAGAHVISLLLEQMQRGLHSDLVITGVVLFANPLRAVTDSPAPGFGVAGQHGKFPVKIPFIDVANPADIICCSERFSPIRGFSNVSKTFSSSSKEKWAAVYIEAARAGKNQQWFNPLAIGSFTRAMIGLGGYLNGVEHGSWYITSGAADRAGQQLRSLLKF